jgi:hypothetical protein
MSPYRCEPSRDFEAPACWGFYVCDGLRRWRAEFSYTHLGEMEEQPRPDVWKVPSQFAVVYKQGENLFPLKLTWDSKFHPTDECVFLLHIFPDPCPGLYFNTSS